MNILPAMCGARCVMVFVYRDEKSGTLQFWLSSLNREDYETEVHLNKIIQTFRCDEATQAGTA